MIKNQKYAYWMRPPLFDEMTEMLESANATSKSDFVCQAVEFYIGYLRQQKNIDYLPLFSPASLRMKWKVSTKMSVKCCSGWRGNPSFRCNFAALFPQVEPLFLQLGMIGLNTRKSCAKISMQGGKGLKIHIIYDETVEEPEVTVICREINDEISRILRSAESRDDRMTNDRLSAVKDGQIFILRYSDIIYFDTADKKTFIYTSGEVYETGLRLYELEEKLPKADFFRANKSCIAGIRHISSIKADIDGRLLLTMDSGDKLWVSRQYASEFRKIIGM